MISQQQEKIKITKEIFETFLNKKNYRKTPERFAILKEIYTNKEHSSIDSIYNKINTKTYHVSRATVYNTIELLLECNLIRKHQFRKKEAQYEKCYFSGQHDHLICTECHIILEFCEPRIYEIKKFIAKSLKFKIKSHAFNLYGLCKSCQKKEDK